MPGKRVVVGISGGLDSFVAALMLQRQGYEVAGVNLRLWGESDLSGVEEVCRGLGIPLTVRDGRELFRRTVVCGFVEGYLSGGTPSPCCVCNGAVKWRLLREAAAGLGADFLATGHYVRIEERRGRHYVRKGIDPRKDQSYFLWEMEQEILAKALTPLGGFTKAEVRAWALAQGYAGMAGRRESMGVCFLEGGDYRRFLREFTGREPEAGEIVDRKGKVIGRHAGILHYTVGQRQGLPVVDGRSMYVAEIDAERNLIVADGKEGLWTTELRVEGGRFVSREDLFASDLKVRVRGLGLNPGGSVRVEEEGENRLRVHLTEPAWAVAPGQPVAFYREDLLVGGGIAGKR